MALGISIRAFGHLIGVTDKVVRKAIKTGRIRTLADGTIDPVQGQKEWLANTDPGRTVVRTSTEVRTRCVPATEGPHPEVRTPWSAATMSDNRAVADPGSANFVTTPEEAREALSLVAQVLQEEGVAVAGVLDFGLARTAETILKARERHLKIAERKKELVPLAAVRGQIEKAFIGYRQAMQRMPAPYASQMAAEVGCDPAVLQAAMEEAIRSTLAELSAPVVRA